MSVFSVTYPTCLHDVELLRDEGVEAMTEGEEEVHGLDRDGAKEPLGPLRTSSAHLVHSDLRGETDTFPGQVAKHKTLKNSSCLVFVTPNS